MFSQKRAFSFLILTVVISFFLVGCELSFASREGGEAEATPTADPNQGGGVEQPAAEGSVEQPAVEEVTQSETEMTEETIKKTWRNLLIPFSIGLLVLIVSILLYRLGSKKPLPQTISLFGCVFGVVFMIFPGLKMIKFRKYLKNLGEE